MDAQTGGTVLGSMAAEQKPAWTKDTALNMLRAPSQGSLTGLSGSLNTLQGPSHQKSQRRGAVTVTTITPCALLPAAAGMRGLGCLGGNRWLSSHLAAPEPSSKNVLVMGGKQGHGKCQDALEQKF